MATGMAMGMELDSMRQMEAPDSAAARLIYTPSECGAAGADRTKEHHAHLLTHASFLALALSLSISLSLSLVFPSSPNIAPTSESFAVRPSRFVFATTAARACSLALLHSRTLSLSLGAHRSARAFKAAERRAVRNHLNAADATRPAVDAKNARMSCNPCTDADWPAVGPCGQHTRHVCHL
ncbi:hypothetical protein GQ42DRAFT_20407 [Ramicandelaber brevisporus]|nr:hypothetical protein GQ42DRAFT_20407 [Ramicandelaber brevisporus]